ncbi:MAG: type II toxin-antitoxin system PemK/MazF family toxin [Actinomycetota bacterium]|nr:type II toxin-antitoxin system PemK/MazF family toxin [Actinomycetota bacterium]
MRSGLIGKFTGFLRGRGREKPAARDIEDTQLKVEYSPSLDGDPDPGEVVWTWVPYEDDPSQGKDRPVVIIGRRGAFLVGVPLTSKRRDDEAQISVGTGPWDREGRPSYAKLERLLEVDPNQVRREGAVLPRKAFDAVVEGVRRLGTR